VGRKALAAGQSGATDVKAYVMASEIFQDEGPPNLLLLPHDLDLRRGNHASYRRKKTAKSPSITAPQSAHDRQGAMPQGANGFGPNLASTVLDISDTGARLIITQPLELLAEVEIIINGYGMKERIRRLGNIRWQVTLESGQFCVGVEFQKSLAFRDWQIIVAPN
jgi:hypothetical protein